MGQKGQALTVKIKQLPEGERPYEKLEMYGEKALTNAELIAIIIKSGTKEYTSKPENPASSAEWHKNACAA